MPSIIHQKRPKPRWAALEKQTAVIHFPETPSPRPVLTLRLRGILCVHRPGHCRTSSEKQSGHNQSQDGTKPRSVS